MNHFFHLIIGKGLPVLATISITGVTLATSVFGVTKVTKNLTPTHTIIPEVKGIQETLAETPTGQTIPSPTATPTVFTSQSQDIILTPIKHPKATLSPTPTPGNNLLSNNNNNQCLVTIFGKQYDITTLLSSHSGGNVFNCGTDMSTIYQSQHGTNVSRMQAYLVTNATAQINSTTTNKVKPTATISRKIDNDYESKDEEDRKDEDKNRTEHRDEN